MSKNIIERIGKQAIIDACNSSKTFKEACEKLNCGYRYLVLAATKLGCFEELNKRSKENSHKTIKLSNPWISKTENGFCTDSKIWCDELFK